MEVGSTVKMSRMSYHFGNVVGDQMRIIHSGAYGPVVLSKSKTTTLFGRFIPPGSSANDDIGTNYFRWLLTTKVGKNIGGADVLDISGWTWAKNHAWIDAAIDRGSEVRAITILNPANCWNGAELSVTGIEFAVMLNKGFGVDAAGIMKPLADIPSPPAWWDDVLMYAQNNPYGGGTVNMLDDIDLSYKNTLMNGFIEPVRSGVPGQTQFFGYQ